MMVKIMINSVNYTTPMFNEMFSALFVNNLDSLISIMYHTMICELSIFMAGCRLITSTVGDEIEGTMKCTKQQ